VANVHHATKKAADKDLSEGTITEQAHAAVIAGNMTLQEARNIGADPTPTDTAGGAAVQDEGTEAPRSASAEDHQEGVTEGQKLCLCGCGAPVSRTFKAGHDSRLLSELRGQIRKGDVLLRSERITDEQREFAVRHGLIGKEALPADSGEVSPNA
jgi:hypothetical protein